MTSTAATAIRDLRTGHSPWHGVAVPAKALKASLQVDVLIVGAGISGALLAHSLAGRYPRVAVVDRRPPAHGSTMASTAMLQFEIDTPLIRLAEQIGPKKAARAWRRSWDATQGLAELVRAEHIDCGFARRDSLYLAGDEMGARALKRECAARNNAGLPGEFLDAKRLRDVFGIERTGAIFSPGAAVADPVALATELLRIADRRGVEIHSPVEITDLHATDHGVMLDTGAHFIEAAHCILCTGYERLKGMPKSGTKITSSWAIASKPRARYPSWLDGTLVWEASKPYLYMRTTPDGRLIVGGEDEDLDAPSRRSRALAVKRKHLLQKTKALLPGAAVKISHSWAGAFGESADALPIIDRVPGMPRCIAVMGFGGNGTIYSKMAAEIVPTLLRGRPDKDADLFRFR
jgi:glycine/D-amino acid oxidase-like deaminating enzyme